MAVKRRKHTTRRPQRQATKPQPARPAAPKAEAGSKASRVHRIDENQRIYPIAFTNEPFSEYKSFQETISGLYGPTGIGKTTFAFNIPGCHVLATEPINNPSEFSHTRIENWPTLKAYIDYWEEHPRYLEGVTMFAIDTIEAIVDKGISTICYEWGILDLNDEGYARAWTELKNELVHTLLRLNALGPGLLLISHEREREQFINRQKIFTQTMNLSKSVREAIFFLCPIVMHMRYVERSETSSELGQMRCICIQGSDEEDAKDNTRYLEKITDEYGVVKFKRERHVVQQILKCFE